jgi:hypothetical protein
LGYNSAFGRDALTSVTTGALNSAFGRSALRLNTTGSGNSAFGQRALRSNTTGEQNSAFGNYALSANTTGRENSAFGLGVLSFNTTGNRSSAFGARTLFYNTTGYMNSAFGYSALYYNTTGNRNSAFGARALGSNTTGDENSAFGNAALFSNTTGFHNSAFGKYALRSNTTGLGNSAFGREALFANTTGLRNVAVGRGAGVNQTTGNDNIYIANDGVAAESGKIKIGNSAHTETFIEGIFGNTAFSGLTVFVNSSNELGTAVSSIRFKEAVRNMGETSDVLMQLRPVTFLYREEVADGDDAPQYGLIAEEVAEVAPELVVSDAEGQPYSVRYHVLPSMLLNEMQKQQRTDESQAGVIEEQRQVIAALASRLEKVEQTLTAAPTATDR